MTGEGNSGGTPRSCSGWVWGSQLCCHSPISGLGLEGEVRDALPSRGEQEPELHLPSRAAVTAAPLPQQAGRATDLPLASRAAPRPPRAPRTVGSVARVISHDRRSLSPTACCTTSWVRILMRQLLCSLDTDRDYRAARHVPEFFDRSRHIHSVILRRLPLAPQRSRLTPPLSQLATVVPSQKRIRQ